MSKKNRLQVFSNQEFGELRTVTIEGEPWFVASDVCKALEISNNRMALERLDDDEKGVSSTDTLGGKQDMGITDKRVETEREKKKQDRRERTSGGMSKKSKPQNERLLQFGE